MALGTSERSSTSSRRWSGCSASSLPVQPIRRVVVSLPAPASRLHVGEDLVAGEAADGAGLVLELGVEQLGHQVVGGVLGPPVDVLGEQLAPIRRLRRRTCLPRLPRGAAPRRDGRGSPPGPARGCRAGSRSSASASRAPRSLMKSKLPDPDEWVERPLAELADLGLEGVHLPRREHPGHQRAVHVVVGRVLEEDDAGGDLDVGPDELEDRSPCPTGRSPSRAGPSRRRRSGSGRRSRTSRCSRAAPRRAAASTPGTGRCRSRSRTGRSRRRCRW